MAHLFSSLRIRNIEFKNRITVSPMCEYSSTDGFANDWHVVHLGSRAIGGAGLIITEATAVSPEGRISPGDLGIWKDEHIVNIKRITDFISQHGSVPGIQLAHAGRKASHNIPWQGSNLVKPEQGGWKTVAPSAIPFSSETDVPTELTHQGIDKVVEDFRKAAQRSLQAGFKVIEIHGAHGYLINEFLSPLSNKRNDEYGGSFENRSRLLLRIVDEIRSVWPDDLPLFVRLSATDWVEEGWTIHDSVRLAMVLKTKGVDLVDCSSGGVITGVSIPLVAGYQVPLAEQVKREAGILTGAVGLITTAKQANEIIADGKADLVIMARQMLRDPYFPLHAAYELGHDVQWPVQYQRAKLTK